MATFLPVLDFDGNDKIYSETEMIDYLLNYILRNARDNSEINPDLQLEYGSLYMKYCNDPEMLASESEDLFKHAIENELGLGGYTVKVIPTADTVTSRKGISVTVTGPANKALKFDKWFTTLVQED